MITIADTIHSLNKKNNNNYEFVIINEPTNETEYTENVFYVSGVNEIGDSIFTDTKHYTWNEITAEKALLQTEYDNKQYHRDRAIAYPSLQEQLDMQYWDKINGTNNWETMIAEIKSQFPKPTT